MPESNEIWELGFQAAVEAGHKPSLDGNGENTVGVSRTEVNVVDGVRQTVSDGYLSKTVRSRPNLTILTGANVWRLPRRDRRCERRGRGHVRGEGHRQEPLRQRRSARRLIRVARRAEPVAYPRLLRNS
jgi:choline dehydrogenase-like flavoprotein